MFGTQKVIWKEGMFLQPQHFQQAERYLYNTLDTRLRSMLPNGFGVTQVLIDTDALANGTVSLSGCSGILPDGCCVETPAEHPLPASRQYADHFSLDREHLDVYLALPLTYPGKSNVAGGSGDCRYRSTPMQITDEVQGDQKKELDLGQYNFSLLFGTESLDSYASMQICRLVRNKSGQVELFAPFIPPLLHIGASAWLMGQIRSMLELLLSRIASFSQGRRQVEGGFAVFAGSEETSFRILQILNTYTPMLNYYHYVQAVHPFELFKVLTELTGALCTVSAEFSIKNLPRYEHTNFGSTMQGFIKIIRGILDADISAACVSLVIEKSGQSKYICSVGDDKLLGAAQFYLGIFTAMAQPKELISAVPTRLKMSSPNTLDLLISSAMPGLMLMPELNPPQSLSTKPGFVYFKLAKQGDFWNNIKSTKQIAFYFPTNVTDLKMELLALRE